jgi:hypothetical protein
LEANTYGQWNDRQKPRLCARLVSLTLSINIVSMLLTRLALLPLLVALTILAATGCSGPEPATPNPHPTPTPQRQFDPSSDRYERQPPFGERGNRS